MAPKKKEHKNDLRNLVVQHYQNGGSQREIATSTNYSSVYDRKIEINEVYRKFIWTCS